MYYENTVEGIFLERENRFIARSVIDGAEVKAHVPNTGRCKELLLPGTPAIFTRHNNPKRKTGFTLEHVWKDGINGWVNIDSASANTVAEEGLLAGKFPHTFQKEEVFREKTFGNSRFDFYLESPDFQGYMEVKGVTLEEEGIAMFPDAPTLRGVKHLEELVKVKEEGMDAAITFVIQMGPMKEFRPHTLMHPEFTRALKEAGDAGVEIFAFDCEVTENRVLLSKPVPVVI